MGFITMTRLHQHLHRLLANVAQPFSPVLPLRFFHIFRNSFIKRFHVSRLHWAKNEMFIIIAIKDIHCSIVKLRNISSLIFISGDCKEDDTKRWNLTSFGAGRGFFFLTFLMILLNLWQTFDNACPDDDENDILSPCSRATRLAKIGGVRECIKFTFLSVAMEVVCLKSAMKTVKSDTRLSIRVRPSSLIALPEPVFPPIVISLVVSLIWSFSCRLISQIRRRCRYRVSSYRRGLGMADWEGTNRVFRMIVWERMRRYMNKKSPDGIRGPWTG